MLMKNRIKAGKNKKKKVNIANASLLSLQYDQTPKDQDDWGHIVAKKTQ